MSIQTAQADVVEWDDDRVKMHCPFCDRIHHHEREALRCSRQSRMTHCDLPSYVDGKYCLNFPFDVRTGKAAYEIDKKRRRFVTIDVRQNEEQDLHSLTSSLEHRLSIADEDGKRVPSLNEGTEEKEYSITLNSGKVIAWTRT